MGSPPETPDHVSVSSRSTNTLIIALITVIGSIIVAWIAVPPADTSDRWYGYQGRENTAHIAENREHIGFINEWIRQHTIFGWEAAVSNTQKFTAIEKDVERAIEVTDECMRKVK